MAKATRSQKKAKQTKSAKKPIKKSSNKPKSPTVTRAAQKLKKIVHPASPQEVKPKREKRVKKAKAAPKIAYDAAQYKSFLDLKKELNEKSTDELKKALKANDQTCTGNKGDLIEKVADGIVLGKTPRCTHCYGGKLRFNYKTGVYTCPGYRDDEDFHFCNKKYQLNEVVRTPWTNI